MIVNKEFESFIRSWFSPASQSFAEELINNPDDHTNWIKGLWYSYIHENSLCNVPEIQ